MTTTTLAATPTTSTPTATIHIGILQAFTSVGAIVPTGAIGTLGIGAIPTITPTGAGILTGTTVGVTTAIIITRIITTTMIMVQDTALVVVTAEAWATMWPV